MSLVNTLDSVSKDFEIITSLINDQDFVLDLGCGDGKLLNHLREKKNIQARGIEKDLDLVASCLTKGLSIYQGDIVDGLKFYKKNFFDVVILSKTIQELIRPLEVITAMLEITDKAIISFLNFGYYRNRLNFLFKGTKPRNEAFPFYWYDTPQLHPLTIKDFEKFCKKKKIKIIKKFFLKGDWKTSINAFPNLLAGHAIYLISRK